VATAALTVYDMCKAVRQRHVIDQIRWCTKVGGKSGPSKRRAGEEPDRTNGMTAETAEGANRAELDTIGPHHLVGIITVSDSSSRASAQDLAVRPFVDDAGVRSRDRRVVVVPDEVDQIRRRSGRWRRPEAGCGADDWRDRTCGSDVTAAGDALLHRL